MTNEEIICTFMEPNPPSKGAGWWSRSDGRRVPAFQFWNPDYVLGILRKVEARLTEEQWRGYRGWFMIQHQMDGPDVPFGTYLLHASAEQKMAALAAVLRPEVER